MAASTNRLDQVTSIARITAATAAVIALGVLGLRAALRFDGGWDSLWYHLPFAALRAGIDVPYEMTVRMHHYYEGFPPLPELAQGILWRITGSVNATGVVNYLAFAGFLAYCHRVLAARFWLVALAALTAPLVIMHAACSYIDLFANSFLAMAAASCLFMVMFPERTTRWVALGGLVGAVGTAWSKIQLIPLAGLFVILASVLALRRTKETGIARRRTLAVCVGAALIAAIPYVKNLVVYGNPVWPVRAPLIGSLFPYAIDAIDEGIAYERPAALRDAPQPEVFVHSLFEIDYPTDLSPRWSMDAGLQQHGMGPAFRMGGYWGLGVVFYLAATFALFLFHDRRRGRVAIVASLAVLALVACLPQSNELRYYLFLPLTWAAGFAMGFPTLQARAPRVAVAGIVAVLVLFGYMVSENRDAYRIERRTIADAVSAYAVERMWSGLRPGKLYCVVGAEPFGILLTGPTLSEFSIIDRIEAKDCPTGSLEIGPHSAPAEMLANESWKMFELGQRQAAIILAHRAFDFDAEAPIAWKSECAALVGLERWEEAVPVCKHAADLHTTDSRANLRLARSHITPK